MLKKTKKQKNKKQKTNQTQKNCALTSSSMAENPKKRGCRLGNPPAKKQKTDSSAFSESFNILAEVRRSNEFVINWHNKQENKDVWIDEQAIDAEIEVFV